MKNLDSVRVLVTGGAGFIGSHLCERLLKDGCEVLCVDNFYTGRRKNVAHLLEDSAFEVIRHDITFPLYVEADQIYNMACPASPVHYQSLRVVHPRLERSYPRNFDIKQAARAVSVTCVSLNR